LGKVSIGLFRICQIPPILTSEHLKSRYEKFKTIAEDVQSEFFSDLTFEPSEVNWVKEVIVTGPVTGDEMPKIGGAALKGKKAKTLVMEIYRFDESGGRRLKFDHGQVELLNGLKLPIIARLSSFATLDRLLGSDPFSGMKISEVVLMPANVDWKELAEVDHTVAHGIRAKHAFEDRSPKDTCLQCGRPLFATSVQLVEIDETGRKYQCGPVHTECLLPTFRVIGEIQGEAAVKYKALGRFDINKWVKLSQSGPAGYELLDAISEPAVILWNWIDVIKPKGKYCVKMIGEDDQGNREEQYVTERGRIVCAESKIKQR
jgi:hypothetical protein